MTMNQSLLTDESVDRRYIRSAFARFDWALCVIAVLVGAFQLINLDSEEAFYVSVSMLSLCGLIGLIKCVLIPEAVTSWLVLASTLALGYGLGTLNTLLSGYRDYMSLLELTYASRADLAAAIGMTLILFAGLYAVGLIDRSSRFLQHVSVTDQDVTLVAWLTSMVAAWVTLLVLTGKIGIQMDISASEGSSNISAASSIVTSALCPMVAIAVYFYAKASGRIKMLLLAAGLAILLVQATQGRRVFIYSIVCCVIAFVASNNRRIFTMKNVFMAVIAVAMTVGASKLFFAMRSATIDVGKHHNLVFLLEKGIEELRQSDRTDLSQRIAENQDTRTFIIGYLAEVLKLSETKPTTGGALFELAIASAVPSMLWPGKWRIMSIGSEETLSHPQFGLPIWDAANSVLTAGVFDFGVAGFFAYPFIVAGVFALITGAAMRLTLQARLMMGFGCVYTLFSVETPIAGYTASLREAIILTAVVQIAAVLQRRWTSSRMTAVTMP